MKKWNKAVAVIGAISLFAAGCGSAKASPWALEPSVECDEIRPLVGNADVCILVQDGQLGLIDYEGNVRLEPKYSSIYQCFCGDNGNNIAVDGYVLNENYEIAGEHPGHGLGNDYAAWNATENKAVSISYDDIYPFEGYGEGRLYVVPEVTVSESPYGGQVAQNTGKYGYIDGAGNLVIPCQFEDAFEFCGGLARVYQEGKYGYVLEDGTISIPIEYDNAYDFGEGVAAVCENGAWKYIDTSGTVVIDLGLEAALPASNGKAWAKLDGKLGILDIEAARSSNQQ